MADKVLFPDISEEKIYVCLEEVMGDNIRFDIIPRPTKIWSKDTVLKSLKELPEKGARKSTVYRTDQEEKADTFLYLVTPENLNLMKPVDIILRVTECVLGSKGFVYIAFCGNLGEEIKDFKALLIEEQKEYSGIRFKEFDKEPEEKELLCWILEEP